MDGFITIDGELSIRIMQDTDVDYALMLKWLTDERVLEHYDGRDKKYTMESIKQKYSPRILGKEKVTPCIIECKKKPIGYIQFYPDPEPDSVFGAEKNVFGIDMFIGEPEYWSKGLGSNALHMMIEYIFSHTDAVKIVIDPDVNNTRAIRAYEKAGFRKVKIIPGYEPHEGKTPDAWLMVCEKGNNNSSGMQIRLVEDNDYPEIAQLRSQTILHVNSKDYSEDVIESWSSKVSIEDFRKSADTCKRWVALEKDLIIGFCEHTFACEISRIYVHKDHLRKGVGSRLLEVAEASLKEQGCKEIHIVSTVTAKDFYEKNGYTVIEKTLYKENENEPIYKMSKRLP